jgi:hypothetical protein
MNGDQAVGALGALAHESRLAIFRMLVKRGPDGLSAGMIAEQLGRPRDTAPRQPPAHLCRRFWRYERSGRVPDRELLRSSGGNLPTHL